jgi:alpha-tubulin suppressor-like RCC1 family protein
MDRRQFLKFLAQSSASVGATVFVERVWGFPMVAALSRNNNKIFSWGAGILNTTTTSSPPVNALTPTKFLPRYDFSSIAVSGTFTNPNIVGITKSGDILTWGSNVNFQQGPIQGTIVAPVLFGTTTLWPQISINTYHGVGVRTNGAQRTLWTWGYNGYGQLGDGTVVNKSTPIQVGSLTVWESAVAGSTATFALQTGGTLFSWGSNPNGYLGNGTSTTYFSSPVQVGSASSWTKISVGTSHVLGIKTGGSLWAWGTNYDGRLGNGTTILANSSPIQVTTSAPNTWSNVFAGSTNSYGIKTDGTLWVWGYNTAGELGIGTVGDVSTPVQIGSATNWASVKPAIDHAIGLKTDGTIWGWGVNHKGQLGNGTTLSKPTYISTPIQIGSGTSWISIGAVSDSNGSASFGLRTK